MSNKEKLSDFFGDIRQHLMTGISYMLPVIIIYALFLMLSQIPGPTQDMMSKISEYSQMLIVPVLATFIAYSIASKPAIASGLIIGLLADQMGMGFIGGLVVGLVTGYFIKLEKMVMAKIPGGQTKDFLMNFLVIPILTPIVMGVFTYFVLANPVIAFTENMTTWLNGMSGANAIILSIILGAMIGFDMGGPINKIAYTFALGAFTEGKFAISAPVFVAITIPTLGMALASILAPQKYSKEEKAAGKTAVVMGLIGLTEGAIPFAATDPFKVIPSIMVGASLGAALATVFGIAGNSLFPSLLGLTGTNKPLLYILCHLIGIVVTALLVNVLKKNVEDA